MHNTQIKYIFIGVVFWLGILIIIIFTSHYNSNANNSTVDTTDAIKKSLWFVQVASFKDRVLLKKLNNLLTKNNYKTKIIFSAKANGDIIRAIRVGPYKSEYLAKQIANKLKTKFKLRPKIILL